jgi:glutathione peroxidase
LYFDRGFRVLGFPCNDFGGQEPGTNEEILEFAQDRFGVTFDMFEKLHCIGPQQHPLYARLISAFTPKEEVRWNFEKFLVDKNGAVVARFRSGVEPGADEMMAAIEKALG